MSDIFDKWKRARGKEPIGATLSVGAIIGEYEIGGLIGRGGSSEVYQATHIKLKSTVAIKILHKLSDSSRLRFDREAKILAHASHTAFPQFKSYGLFEGRPYIVTELLGDCVLPRKDKDVATFILRLLEGAGVLHRLGFVHRDIKPANILMRDGTDPVLTDFGLACPISASSQIRNHLSIVDGRLAGVGTPGYAAPEQFDGGEVGAATDIYAIGKLIDECFDGKPPRRWRSIIYRATNSRPNVRYAAVEDMMRAIKRRKWRERIEIAVALMGLAILLGIWAFPRMSDETKELLPILKYYKESQRIQSSSSEARIAYALSMAKKMYENQLQHPEYGFRGISIVSFTEEGHEAFFDLTPEIIEKYGTQATNLFNQIQRDYEAGKCGRPMWHNTWLVPRNVIPLEIQ